LGVGQTSREVAMWPPGSQPPSWCASGRCRERFSVDALPPVRHDSPGAGVPT
jgi:hypothetical protein